jgi:uncharacterized pyridoxamine 5'-phosphate oxidase family protein
MSEPTDPIALGGRIAQIIDRAAVRGVAVAVAYVDADGLPHLSPRGTVHVVGPDTVALWARTSGMPDALAVNPNVALLYQDLAQHDVLVMTGRGRVVDDADMRDRIFDGSPAHEQAYDPERTGTAIVIELDSVRGRTGEDLVAMERATVS